MAKVLLAMSAGGCRPPDPRCGRSPTLVVAGLRPSHTARPQVSRASRSTTRHDLAWLGRPAVAPAARSGDRRRTWSIPREVYQAAFLRIPQLEPQTTVNLSRVQTGGARRLQLLDGGHRLRKPVKRNACVEVMDVVIADVAGEPRHQRPGVQEAGGF